MRKTADRDQHSHFTDPLFITDQTGELVAEADRKTEQVILATFDLNEMQENRLSWGNLPGQKTGVLQGISVNKQRTHENTLFTGQTSKEGILCVPLLIVDTRVVILHKKCL